MPKDVSFPLCKMHLQEEFRLQQFDPAGIWVLALVLVILELCRSRNRKRSVGGGGAAAAVFLPFFWALLHFHHHPRRVDSWISHDEILGGQFVRNQTRFGQEILCSTECLYGRPNDNQLRTAENRNFNTALVISVSLVLSHLLRSPDPRKGLDS